MRFFAVDIRRAHAPVLLCGRLSLACACARRVRVLAFSGSQMNLSKTAARMSSKQKRRRKNGKELGTAYEDKHAGKVVNKSKRKGRMLAMKQMY